MATAGRTVAAAGKTSRMAARMEAAAAAGAGQGLQRNQEPCTQGPGNSKELVIHAWRVFHVIQRSSIESRQGGF
jgi:hypothetical protein